MKVLAVSDEESGLLWNGGIREAARDVELIISCGDLRREYLEYILTMTNLPLLYVPGNHDSEGPEGGICIDGDVRRICGLAVMGLGGSMRYRQGRNMYSESEMNMRYQKLRLKVWFCGGINILVTHAPARGFGDMEDAAHRGFEVFGKIMRKYRPQFMLHGHVHRSYGRFRREILHPSGTRVINACGYHIFSV